MKKLFIILILIAAAGFFLSGCAGGLSKREASRLYYNLGNAYLELGDNTKASQAYLKALEYDRKMKIASYNLIKAYIEVEKYTEALSIIDRMIADDPDNVLLLSAKGFCLYRFGNLEKAAEHYIKIFSIDPSNQEAVYNYAVIKNELEEYEPALEKLFHLKKLDIKDGNMIKNINFMIGRIYFENEEYEESIPYLEAVRENEKENLINLKMLFKSYKFTEYYADMLKTGFEILEYEPDESSIMFDISFIMLTAVEDPSAGIEYLEKSIAAGFNDKEKSRALVDSRQLIEREKVKKILEREKLLDD